MATTQTPPDISAIRMKHSQRQKKRMRIMKIRRTVFFSSVTLIFILVIMFFTPVFKIRSIEVNGLEKVEEASIMQCTNDAEGKNLFRTRTSAIKKNILKIPYVSTVEIDRKIFKSKLVINVKECAEAAYFESVSGYIIIDDTAKVLGEMSEKPTNIPEIIGLSIANIVPGEKLKIEDNEKFDIVLLCLEEMRKLELLNGVRSLSVSDVSDIRFNYEDRMDALCGSNVDLPKKLGFFKSAINSSRLTENSRGTIDLTTVGRAVYTP